MILAYKQARFEQNTLKFVSELVANQDLFNERMEKLDEDMQRIVKSYFALVMDHATETDQEEKIEYMITGYINLAKGAPPKEDVIMMYYDTLDELSLLDIRYFKLFVAVASDDDGERIRSDYGIDYRQTALIRDKLIRLGLLESKMQKEYTELFNSVKAIIDYLELTAKGKAPKKLKVEKLDKRRADKIVLSSYGNSFYNFFMKK